MAALSELVTYTATIIVALALNALILALMQNIIDDRVLSVTLLWVYAGLVVITAVVVCYVTGEALSFGEDIA